MVVSCKTTQGQPDPKTLLLSVCQAAPHTPVCSSLMPPLLYPTMLMESFPNPSLPRCPARGARPKFLTLPSKIDTINAPKDWLQSWGGRLATGQGHPWGEGSSFRVPSPRLGGLGGAGQPQLARLVFPSPGHAGGLPLSPQFATGNAN